MEGTFIVLEGIDGAGKSTQAEMLAKELKEENEVYLTQEPSKRSIGDFIRESVLGSNKEASIIDGDTLDPKAEVLLFTADRAEHCEQELIPALKEGKIVISDRYFYSTYAYQAAREGIDLEWLKKVNEFAIRPDLVILLDIPVKEGLKRIDKDPDYIERVEQIQHKARENYMELSEDYDEIFVVDGKKSTEKVHGDIHDLVKNFMEKEEKSEEEEVEEDKEQSEDSEDSAEEDENNNNNN